MNTQNTLSKRILTNAFGIVLLRSVSFITAPIMSRLLTPADYGLISSYSVWVGLLGLFVGLQTHGTISNAVLDIDKKDMPQYYSSVLSISFFSTIIIAVPMWLFNAQLGNLLQLTPRLILLMAPQCFGSFCVSYYSAKLIVEKKAGKNLLLSLTMTILTGGLSIFLAWRMQVSYLGGIYGGALPSIAIGLVVFIWILCSGKKVYNKEYWRYALSISLPLIAHGLSSMVFGQSDRLMLRYMVGDVQAGLYSWAYNFSLVISSIWSSVNAIWTPYYFELLQNGDIKRTKEHLDNFNRFYCGTSIGFVLLTPEVYRTLAPEAYWDGLHIVPLVVLAYYFNHLYSFPANYEFYRKKTKWIAVGTTMASVVNIVLNLLMIPHMGQIGAALATTISYLGLFVFHHIIARRALGGFTFKISEYCRESIWVILACVLCYFTLDTSLWMLRWGLGALIGLYVLYSMWKRKAFI
jgi:O-antigen/teichoic acid export membrane protein